MPLQTWLQQLWETGIPSAWRASDPEHPLARYVRLTNLLAVCFALFSLSYAPLMIPLGHWEPPTINFIAGIIWLGSIVWNGCGHYTAARLHQALVPTLQLAWTTILVGREMHGHFFLLTGLLVPFALYSDDERWALMAHVLILLAGFTVAEVWNALYPPLLVINPAYGEVFRGVVLFGLLVFMCLVAGYHYAAEHAAERALRGARERSDQLLRNILPDSIAARLKQGETPIADHFIAVTVLFADLVGFTPFSRALAPETLVQLLDDLFRRFDEIAGQHGLEKIKTIGDAYMIVAGLPDPRPDHALAMAEMALAMLAATEAFARDHNVAMPIRIGMHSGPAVAGVIGRRKFAYDLWGDTVNTAARMEAHGVSNRIQITETTRQLLSAHFEFEPRGEIEVKGVGRMPTWWLVRRKS
jgi:class 3 adenylate cyclase